MAADPAPRKLTICNEKGLHARPSARLVSVAQQFKCEILVRKDDMEVSATSIMGLLMLGAAFGHVIELEAQGPEAQAALDAITALVESGFGEGAAPLEPDNGIKT